MQRVEADRSFNLLRGVAKARRCTVNNLILFLENAIANNPAVVEEFLNNIQVTPDDPGDLIAELKSYRPTKVDPMFATPPKKAATALIESLAEKRRAREECAVAKVKNLLGDVVR